MGKSFRLIVFAFYDLQQIFCICRLKFIFLSQEIPSSSTLSDDIIIFPPKDMFFFQCFCTLKET